MTNVTTFSVREKWKLLVWQKLQLSVNEKDYNSRYNKSYNFQCIRKVTTPGMTKFTTFRVRENWQLPVWQKLQLSVIEKGYNSQYNKSYNFQCMYEKRGNSRHDKKIQLSVTEKSYNSWYDKSYNFQCMTKVTTFSMTKVTTFSVWQKLQLSVQDTTLSSSSSVTWFQEVKAVPCCTK